MTKTISFVSLIILIFCSSCNPTKTSVLTGYNFDESQNHTNYYQLPYGSVTLPGKWDKTKFNSTGGQQFFINKDSVSISIAFNQYDQYEFNESGEKKGFEFVKAFYEWDSKYFVESFGLERKEIESNKTKHYLIYKIFGETEKTTIDSYFLVGERNGYTSVLSVSITDAWKEEEKIDFLKKLFISPDN